MLKLTCSSRSLEDVTYGPSGSQKSTHQPIRYTSYILLKFYNRFFSREFSTSNQWTPGGSKRGERGDGQNICVTKSLGASGRSLPQNRWTVNNCILKWQFLFLYDGIARIIIHRRARDSRKKLNTTIPVYSRKWKSRFHWDVLLYTSASSCHYLRIDVRCYTCITQADPLSGTQRCCNSRVTLERRSRVQRRCAPTWNLFYREYSRVRVDAYHPIYISLSFIEHNNRTGEAATFRMKMKIIKTSAKFFFKAKLLLYRPSRYIRWP